MHPGSAAGSVNAGPTRRPGPRKRRHSRRRRPHARRRWWKTGCRFSSKTSCTFTLILQSAKVPKYHQSVKTRRRALKYQNIGCIDADFCADFAIFLHFSRSTRIICRKRVKMPENARILRTNFRKIIQIFRKWAKSGCILILWLCCVLWYFAGFLYYQFEAQ